MNAQRFYLACLAVALAIVPTSAHHSFAMFDGDTTLTTSGTVESFQWTNPHCWLEVVVKERQGPPRKWSFEMGSPQQLARQGLKPKSILRGDAVTLTYHPMKDGTPGGQFLTASFDKGLTVGRFEGRGRATAPPRGNAN